MSIIQKLFGGFNNGSHELYSPYFNEKLLKHQKKRQKNSKVAKQSRRKNRKKK